VLSRRKVGITEVLIPKVGIRGGVRSDTSELTGVLVPRGGAALLADNARHTFLNSLMAYQAPLFKYSPDTQSRYIACKSKKNRERSEHNRDFDLSESHPRE
jgi:hypothetical protein